MGEHKKTIRVRVFRRVPGVIDEGRYEDYEVETYPKMKALGALDYINERYRANIAYRRSCRDGNCGSCTLLVDGVASVACKADVADGTVLEPLPGYPLIRDLVVDRSRELSRFREEKIWRMGKEVGGFARITPDQLVNFKKLTICVDCAACNVMCPVLEKAGFVGPMYMTYVARMASNPLDEGDRVAQAYDEGLYSCILCGFCKEVCPKNIDMVNHGIIKMREASAERGLMPEALKTIRGNILDHGDPLGINPEEKTLWARELDFSQDKSTVFFASTYPIMGYIENILTVNEYLRDADMDFDAMAKISGKISKSNARYRETLAHMVKILRDLGVNVGYLYEEEPSCGHELYLYGFVNDFTQYANEVFKLLREAGVKEIIAPDPHVVYAFKELYPRVVKGFDIAVRTLVEVLYETLRGKNLRLSIREGVKVAYHDPCYLARYLGIIEQPRKILSRIDGVEVFEPKSKGLSTRCCGFISTYPGLTRDVTAERLKDLVGTGAEKILTACPVCMAQLRVGAKALKHDVEVLDIADLVHEVLLGGGQG
ncbi:MAG: 2Fe-2S iron-sulfur cluster-binding protein [Candidatus Geothermarchaeales archaeon]